MRAYIVVVTIHSTMVTMHIVQATMHGITGNNMYCCGKYAQHGNNAHHHGNYPHQHSAYMHITMVTMNIILVHHYSSCKCCHDNLPCAASLETALHQHVCVEGRGDECKLIAILYSTTYNST